MNEHEVSRDAIAPHSVYKSLGLHTSTPHTGKGQKVRRMGYIENTFPPSTVSACELLATNLTTQV